MTRESYPAAASSYVAAYQVACWESFDSKIQQKKKGTKKVGEKGGIHQKCGNVSVFFSLSLAYIDMILLLAQQSEIEKFIKICKCKVKQHTFAFNI